MSNRLEGPIKWVHVGKRRWTRYGPHLAHGKNGRSTILKEDVSWKTISGVMVTLPGFSVWIYLRNWR